MTKQSVVDEKALRRAQAFKDFLDAGISGCKFQGYLARAESDIGAVASMQEAARQLLGSYGSLVSVDAFANTRGEIRTDVLALSAGSRRVLLSARFYVCDGSPVFETELRFHDGSQTEARRSRGVGDSRVTKQIREFIEAGLEELTSPDTYFAGSYSKSH